MMTSPDAVTDERLLCQCGVPCSERATQEDGYCDACREHQGAASVGHAHFGDVGTPPGGRMRPVAGTWSMQFTFTGGLGS